MCDKTPSFVIARHYNKIRDRSRLHCNTIGINWHTSNDKLKEMFVDERMERDLPLRQLTAVCDMSLQLSGRISERNHISVGSYSVSMQK